PTRRILVLSTWLSSDSTMSITVPSAAATITFRFGGTVRSGSRKKATVERNSNTNNSDNHTEKNAVAMATSAKNAKIHRASESVWRRIKGLYFRSPKQRGQDPKNQQTWPILATTISWALALRQLQPVAEITASKPRDYYLFPGHFWLSFFVWVVWPTFMPQVQEEIPVEKL